MVSSSFIRNSAIVLFFRLDNGEIQEIAKHGTTPVLFGNGLCRRQLFDNKRKSLSHHPLNL